MGTTIKNIGGGKIRFYILSVILGSFLGFWAAPDALAQDKIITKNAETIEATVLEIDINDIRYKKADNPEGPVFVISKSDIATIIYGNGSIDVFNEEEKKPEQNFYNRSRYPQSYEGMIPIGDPMNGGCWYDPEHPRQFDIVRGEWNYNNSEVNYTTIYNILNREVPDFANRLLSFRRLGKAGIGLFGAGCGLAGLGFIYMMLGTDSYSPDYTLTAVGTAMFVSGTLMALPAGVTMWVVGYKMRDKTIRDYNSYIKSSNDYSYVPRHELKLIQGKYGVGLALTF